MARDRALGLGAKVMFALGREGRGGGRSQFKPCASPTGEGNVTCIRGVPFRAVSAFPNRVGGQERMGTMGGCTLPVSKRAQPTAHCELEVM